MVLFGRNHVTCVSALLRPSERVSPCCCALNRPHSAAHDYQICVKYQPLQTVEQVVHLSEYIILGHLKLGQFVPLAMMKRPW